MSTVKKRIGRIEVTEKEEDPLNQSKTGSEDESGNESNSNSDSNSDSEEEDVSSDFSSDEDDNDENNDDENAPPQKKKAKQIVEGDDFNTALNAILNSKIKAHNTDNPVLIRDQRSAKQIDQDREEAKAKKAIKADKMKQKDKARVKDIIPKDSEKAGESLQHEKTLRKIAQRGVVRLLNAIHGAQSAVINGEPQETEVSKEKFLDMIKMG